MEKPNIIKDPELSKLTVEQLREMQTLTKSMGFQHLIVLVNARNETLKKQAIDSFIGESNLDYATHGMIRGKFLSNKWLAEMEFAIEGEFGRRKSKKVVK